MFDCIITTYIRCKKLLKISKGNFIHHNYIENINKLKSQEIIAYIIKMNTPHDTKFLKTESDNERVLCT